MQGVRTVLGPRRPGSPGTAGSGARPRPPFPPAAQSRVRPPSRSRLRRRGWARRGLAAAAGGVALLVLSVGLAPAAGAADPSVTFGYFTGSLATPATIIATTPGLLGTIPAKISWSPTTAGVTALAEMQGGGIAEITDVGNPPVIGAIGNGVDFDVLWANNLTASTLIVGKSIKKPSQLAGKTIGDLEGSSTDYQLRGWLKVEHLTTSVTVDGFPSTAAVAAAELSGKLQGGYVGGVQATQLTGKGGHVLVNSKQIAKVGYPGFGVLAVAKSLIQSNPTLVQKYVCADLTAVKDFTGPDATKYFKQSAGMLGIPVATAVSAGKADQSYYITPSQEKSWLVGSDGKTDSGEVVAALLKTAQFDLSQKRITSVPSKTEVAAHVDPTFAFNALAGHCS